MASLSSSNNLYSNLVSLDSKVTTAVESQMSLNENGQHMEAERRLRQPLTKSADMGDFSTNGTSEAVHNSKNPWPLKPNATNLPGDQVTPNPWGTSLFDFSSFSPALAGSNGWQNLKGLNDSPWRNPQLNGHGHQQQQHQQQVQQPPGFPPGFEAIFCNSCEESNSKAIAYCQDCNEHICETCYHAHLRVKLTKDHKISMLASSESSSGKSAGGASSSSASSSSSVASSLAVKAPSKTTAIGDLGLSSPSGDFLATRSMQSEVLQVYQGAVEKAKSESKSLMNKASVGITQIDEATNHICETRSRVELKCNALRTEIMTIGQNYVLEVKKRQDLLVSRLEAIIKTKLSVLDGQATDLSKAKKSLKSMTEQLSLCTSQGHEMDLIKATNQANETLKDIQLICGNLMVHEDDNVFFTYPDPGLMKALSNFSFIGGSGYAPLSLADGDGLRKAILGKEAKFIVVVKDQLGEQRVAGGDDLRVSVVGPDGRIVRHSISDGQNGTYRVSWKPSVVGEHFINVTLKDMHVQKSPFRINVRMGRNYSTVSEPVKCFGSEGEADGQLCRPWGVCCTKTGLILVANRSNNRIDVYDKDGVFKYNFGTGGKLQGEFDRPASVCVDNLNRAVITDKDNHRIQVFSLKGEFILMFGEKGSKPGQFNYPWDVATNSRDQILVSDTRNHRIQLFSARGEFLLKYGFEGRDWKHFDSPRGVCFMPDDQIVVTDFNNHRLLVVNQELTCAQYLGKEGSDEGMFTRPNGVAVDEEGNIIVADSRNDRIQVFTSSGRFISKFGTKGTGPGEFDRPSGICISPEGAIIVVDFGNNRVQIF